MRALFLLGVFLSLVPSAAANGQVPEVIPIVEDILEIEVGGIPDVCVTLEPPAVHTGQCGFEAPPVPGPSNSPTDYARAFGRWAQSQAQ